MSELTLLTGATGFIGRYVLRRLLERGDCVRVFVRHPELLPPNSLARVQVVPGDIRDSAALERAVRGASTVLHLAACARSWSRHPEEFDQVNLDAVGTLVAAAERHGARRLVHVSTVLTILPHGTRPLTAYERTKLAGERLAEGCEVATIVHPTRVYGPGPLNDANGATKVIAAYLAGHFPFRLADHDVLASYVHVDDVAAGILLAATRGQAGAHYVLGGENVSLRELLARVASLSGVHHRVFPIRPGVALAGAAAAEAWGRLGGSVPISRDWVRLFLEDQRLTGYAGPPGYTPRPLDVGLAETIAWLRAERRAA
jgi:farnesol dehydrogenase